MATIRRRRQRSTPIVFDVPPPRPSAAERLTWGAGWSRVARPTFTDLEAAIILRPLPRERKPLRFPTLPVAAPAAPSTASDSNEADDLMSS